MKLSDIIVPDAVVPELRAKTKEEAVQELAEALAEAGAIPRKSVPDVTKAVMKREARATTGIGKGVALPHEKIKGIKKPIGAVGRSNDGVDFAALDSKPVYSVFLLLSNLDNPNEHLMAMETIFKHLQRDLFRKFLRQSQTKEAILDLIREADELG